MAILVYCPCGQTYSVRKEFAGRQVLCQHCQRSLPVPTTSLPTPQNPAPFESDPSMLLPPVARPRWSGLLLPCLLVVLLIAPTVLLLLNLDTVQELLAGKDDPRTEGPALPGDIPPPRREEPSPQPPPVAPPPVPRPAPREEKPPPKEVKPPPDPVRPPPPPDRLPTFEGHSGSVLRVGFTRDGRNALSAAGGVAQIEGKNRPASDSTIRIWDARSGKQLGLVKGFPTGMSAVAFSPEGHQALLAGAGREEAGTWVAGADLELHLWDLQESRLVRSFSGHLREPMCLAISADGQAALSGGRDRVIRMWELRSGKEINRLVGHTNTVNSVAFSPVGRRALSASSDFTIRLWDLTRGVEERKLDGHQDIVWAIAISPDGKLALSGGGYQPGPAGQGLVPGNKDFALRLWDLAEGKELRRFEGHTEAVSGVAFSPDGRRALSAGADRTVKLWQTTTGKLLQTFSGHTSLVNTVAFSPDGRYGLSGGEDGLRVWELPLEVADLLRILRQAREPAQLRKAVESLVLYGEAGREGLPDLLRLLASDQDELRKAVLANLGKIGQPGPADIPHLTPLLKPSLPAEVRQYALDQLAGMGEQAAPAARPLAELLRDQAASFRVASARGLGAIGPVARNFTYPLLIEALRDADPAVGKAAREAIDRLGPPNAADLNRLRALLDDPSIAMRGYALDALTQLKEAADPARVELARLATTDPSAEIRRSALKTLGVVAPLSKEASQAIRKGLADREVTVTRQAASALESLPVGAALEGWLLGLEHSDAEVARIAGEAMEKVKWEKAHAKQLGEHLVAAAPAGRSRLLTALASLGPDAADAWLPLSVTIRKADPKEQFLIVTLLGKIGPAAREAGPELLPLLKRDMKDKDRDAVLPLETAYTLIEIGAGNLADDAAIGLIVSAIRIENEEPLSLERRDRAMKTLVKLGRPALPRLLRSLEGEYAVGNLRTPAAIVRAVARLKVIEVLAAMGPKQAAGNEVLVALARAEREEPFPEIRQAIRTTRMTLQKKE